MKTLQDIVRDIDIDDPIWNSSSDVKKFSYEKTLFKFQQEALESAIRALYFYYQNKDEENSDRKNRVFNAYKENDLESPDFANRMSFWMATGSGKTLVIIKLIEILGQLISAKAMPERDILFLAHKDELIQQFEALVDEFNQFSDMKIKLISLRDYDRTKTQFPSLLYNKEINIFYYRSDLFFDETKDKQIDYKSYINDGNWYVLLDEAHKGDIEGNNQKIYTKLSENGFLFNFSATFTGNIAKTTCVYNFNLEKFINNGYGKQIYVSQSNASGFREADNFSKIEKQKIILKTLILQTYIIKKLKEIRNVDASLYHKPLLLTVVNSINKKEDLKKDADLKMVFTELARIANDDIIKGLFEAALESLAEEMHDKKYIFGDESIKIKADDLHKIKYKDVLKEVFHAEKPGELECLTIAGNNKEIVFRVKTSSKNFALIRIGDNSKWVKDLISGDIEINEKSNADSEFGNLNNDDSDINILMGSRTFYEGWDSNRPNIILFVNIGMGKESQKFVLQTVGRGVRIEPQKNKKRRLDYIPNFDVYLRNKIKEHFNMLESLFVFGTNANNLTEIIETMRDIASENIGKYFIENIEDENTGARKKKLLIPIYVESEKFLASEKQSSLKISEDDFDYSKRVLEEMSEKIAIVKLDRTPENYKRVKDAMKKHEKRFDKSETRNINSSSILIKRIFDYFNLKTREFTEDFETAEGKIIHFKKIEYREKDGDFPDLIEKIEFMSKFPENKESVEGAYGKVPLEEFDKLSSLLKNSKEHRDVSIKYIANHYYHPLLVSKKERLDYLTHIISVDSEIEFIKELEGKIEKFSTKYDWWMFSKLDETLDSVNIPYYNASKNEFANFHPDFIFWMKKGNKYSIVFVDPKSATYTSYEKKADWHSKYFGNATAAKTFESHNMEIKVYLRFFTDDRNLVSDGYNDYWIDNVEDIFNL